jgi:hypothetical protein
MRKKKSQSYGDTLKEWELITEACTVNEVDLHNLTEQRDQLEALLDQAKAVLAQQAAFTASRQDRSIRLLAMLEDGRKLASFLRAGIKQRYGNRSEKLAEFGVRPLRPRRSSPSTQPPPGPEAPAPDPDSQS